MSDIFQGSLSDNTVSACEDGVINVVVDLEDCAREGRKPPISLQGYLVKINGEKFVFCSPKVSGREILLAAGLTPPENYSLRLMARGERPRKIKLDEIVDLTEKGIEKFRAIIVDQTEG